MTTTPIRLDRLQAGIVRWLEVACPEASVLWGLAEASREAQQRLVITARILSGPSDTPIGGSAAYRATLPMSATWRVLPAALAAVGSEVGLRASGRSFGTVIPSTPTLEAIRDALLEAIGDTPMVDATFVAVDDDVIEIEALDAGDLYKLAAMQSASGLCTLTTTSSTNTEVCTTEVVTQIEVQAWGSRYPRSGASHAMARIVAGAGLSERQAVLDAFGLGVNLGSPVSLDTLSGPQWESRSALSMRVMQLSIAAAAGPIIQSVRATLQARGQGPTVVIPITPESPP